MSSTKSTVMVTGTGGLDSRSNSKSNMNMNTQTLLDEMGLDKSGFFDLGHPLLNRIAHTFVTAAGIGAIQAVTREAYSTAAEGAGINSSSTNGVGPKNRHGFPGLSGGTNRKSVEALVKNTGKESMQWGVTAGVFSGITYGLKEARGSHDWKNSAVAGALTGMTVALTADGSNHEQVVQSAITGAAIATVANLLTGIF